MNTSKRYTIAGSNLNTLESLIENKRESLNILDEKNSSLTSKDDIIEEDDDSSLIEEESSESEICTSERER
jgi:hypothetical protein